MGGAGDGDVGPRLTAVEACPEMADRQARDGARRRWPGRAAVGTSKAGRMADTVSGAGGDDQRGGWSALAPMALAASGVGGGDDWLGLCT